jgi:dTDP-4-dehydrorhamnose reductase
MKKILLTGAMGQLGSELRVLLAEHPDLQCASIDINELDLTDQEAAQDFLNSKHFDLIINCAAYTAVDKAEEEEDKALLINARIPAMLADYVQRNSAFLIHISTDYVYGTLKNTPYRESDMVDPQSAYGRSKLAGEREIIESTDNFIIIRTSWLYSVYGANFLKSMIRFAKERKHLRVVYDQIGSPTYAADLAEVILKFAENPVLDNLRGIYHFSNEGLCSWFDFAYEIIKMSGLDCRVEPILTHEYPLPAQRPAFSVLDKKKIREALNITIPHWRDSLEICLKKLQTHKE